MINLIKELLKDGHNLTIIEVKAEKTVTIQTQMFDIPAAKSFKIKSVQVVNPEEKTKRHYKKREIKEDSSKLKRINWKTIAKIKQSKADGFNSETTAKGLGLDVETVNKHWA